MCGLTKGGMLVSVAQSIDRANLSTCTLATSVHSDELMHMFDVNVAGTASVMKHMMPLVIDSNEKKVFCRCRGSFAC